MRSTVTVPTIANYGTGQGNSIVVTDARAVAYYFSYRTCVAFYAPSTGLVVRQNSWGPTTGKHLNWIDGGSAEAKASRLSGVEFDEALAKLAE